jgi:hypothetical protein
MPATSKAQQKAAGAALAAKRGETSRAQLEEASREMYDSMTMEELEDLASTPLEGLPEHAAKKSADMGHGDQLRHQQQQNQDRRNQQAGGQNQDRRNQQAGGQNQTHGQDGKKDKDAQKNQGNLDQNDPRRSKDVDPAEEDEDSLGNRSNRVPDSGRNPASDEQRQFGNEDRTNREIGTEDMPDPIEVDRDGNARRSKDEA